MVATTLSSINTSIRRAQTENLLIMRQIRGCTWRIKAGHECHADLTKLQEQYEKNEDYILDLCDMKARVAYEITGAQGSSTVGLHVGDMLSL